MPISIHTQQRSEAWDSFEKSDFAKRTVSAMNKKASTGSEPGPLASNSWQKGNGEVPINPEGAKGITSKTPIKIHNINEVQKEIHDVANSAPTGRLAATLVRMVKIAEAWENSGDTRLAPYVAELDGIIESAMAEHTASFKKKAQLSNESLVSTSPSLPLEDVKTEEGTPPAGVYRISWHDDGMVDVDVVSLGKTSTIPGVKSKGVVSLLNQAGDEENCTDLIAIQTSSTPTSLETIVDDYLSFCSDQENNDMVGAKQLVIDAFKKVI